MSAAARPRGLERGVGLAAGASAAVARAEALLAGFGILATCGLILLNVTTRTLGVALFWVDEAAIYCMVWSAFLGASLTIRNRSAIALDLVKDFVPPRAARIVARVSQTVILSFALSLLVLCWVWFDPAGLVQHRFDLDAFAGSTFNFIYREPTLTLGLPKWPIWLIVPIFGITVALHAAANLTDGSSDLWAPRLDFADYE